MNDLSTPLTDEECDLLDRFLLERIDEEADTLDKDEGVLDISELDGLFTAARQQPDKHGAVTVAACSVGQFCASMGK